MAKNTTGLDDGPAAEMLARCGSAEGSDGCSLDSSSGPAPSSASGRARRWDAPLVLGGRPAARFTRVVSVAPTTTAPTARIPPPPPAQAATAPSSSAAARSGPENESVQAAADHPTDLPRSPPRPTVHPHPHPHPPPPRDAANGPTAVDRRPPAPPKLEGLAANLVGSVVERPTKTTTRKKKNVQQQQQKKKKQPSRPSASAAASRFGLERGRAGGSGSTGTGFPSLDVPFGTYAGRPTTEACRPSSASASAAPSSSFAPSAPTPPRRPIQTPSVPAPATNNSDKVGDDAANAAAASDADAILAGMSVEEIRREQDELKELLSDETLAFLRERRARRQREPQTQTQPSRASDGSTDATTSGAADRPSSGQQTEAAPLPGSIGGSRFADQGAESEQRSDVQKREKERLARLLSSIRTHHDLDAAYEAEMTAQGAGDGAGEDLDGGGGGGGGIVDGKDDFALACDLLRSSVRRQTIWAARAVAERLRRDLDSGACCSLPEQKETDDVDSSPPPWPYPVLLPVSLRCLLDSSPTGSCGYVLHTYVLQSMYFLLQLRACKSHVVNLLNEDSTLSIHQLYFMEDALPTPRMSSCYSGAEPATVDISGSGENPRAAVYDTSSQSAQSDGLSFVSDPMWTLLSRMRLIPRLASLLRASGPGLFTPPVALSDEAFVSMGGVLAMLAMRSPGAAVAIAQHETLLPDLLIRSSLVPAPTDTAGVAPDPRLAIPALRLLCCLAQQSSTAAQCVDMKAFLFRVVATAADFPADETYHRLRVWTLVLWRTLLRYGISLDLTPTLLSLCVPHVTLGPNETSLGPELFSALASVARCVRVANQRRCQGAKGAPVPEETTKLLFGAGAWITSTWRHAVKHIENGHISLSEENSTSQVLALRFYGSCMRFMESYVAIHLDDESETSGEFKTNGLAVLEEDACVASLLSIVKADKFRELLHFVMLGIFSEPDESEQPSGEEQREAALLFFLDSLTALSLQLRNYAPGGEVTGYGGSSCPIQLITSLAEAIVEETANAIRTVKPTCRREPVQESNWRIAWQSRFLFSSCNLLASLHSDSYDTVTSEAVTRGLCLFTIGTFQCGDESRAAILISHDWLFNVGTKRSATGSVLSSVFLRELCRTSYARSQLDHSFKLSGGFGITAAGFGAFDMQSLRSEADYAHGSGVSLGGLHLPLGPLWLWEMLSGVVIVEDEDPEASPGGRKDEVSQIIAAALELILELETSSDEFMCWYTSTLDTGTKLYHIINVCLQPESIFQCAMIQSTLTSLLDVYLPENINSAKGLIAACKSHSLPKASKTSKSTSSASTPHDPVDGSKLSLTRVFDERTRSLEDFVSDLCDAFAEFGAQYASFTRSIRLFLLPSFPSSIRCVVLEKLRGLEHLLTVDGEDVRHVLSSFLLGGLPTVDKSCIDAPEFVDSLCAVHYKTSCFRNESAGFVHSLTVAVLVRSLAHCLLSADDDLSGRLLSCKRRLTVQDRSLRIQVIQATARFLSSNGTLSDLLEVTFAGPLRPEENQSLTASAIEAAMDECGWDRLWMPLRASISDRLAGDSSLNE